MPDIVYRLTRSQAIYWWVLAATGPVLGIVAAALISADRRVTGPTAVLAISAGCFLLFALPICIWHLSARTDLTQAGLRTSHLLTHRTCRWDEVSELTTPATYDSKYGIGAQVVLRLRDGRKITLAMPRTWDPFPADRHFEDKVSQIRARFSASAEAPSRQAGEETSSC